MAVETIDQQARERVNGWIADLEQDVGRIELRLATLAGFFDEGLPAAVVGAMGISAGEIRQQLPAIRQAVRDLEGGS